MRIALLLETNGERRVVMLPRVDRLASPFAESLGVEGDANDIVLLKPVGAGVFDEEEWENLGLGDRVSVVDDEQAIEALIGEGGRALEAGDVAKARACYEKCEALLGSERTMRRAGVLAGLATIARSAEQKEDAIRLLDEAIAIAPGHRGALQQRLEMARANDDAATAATLRRKLHDLASTDDERIRGLSAIADDALTTAVDAMRAALALRPGHRVLLERLRAMYEAAGQFAQAVDVAVQRAEALAQPRDRARAFVSAAQLCADRAKNVGRAVALYEAAIADDPEVPGAFAAIEGVLLADQDFAGAEKAYVRQLERLQGRNAIDAEAELLDKLAHVRGEKLGDLMGAVQALDKLVTLRPTDVEARVRLAALLEQNKEDALAVRCLEVAARLSPMRSATFQVLHRIFDRIGDVDRSYHACSALVYLGEADIDEQLVYQQHSPDIALQPKRSLDDVAWDLLQPEDHDRDLSAVIRAMAPAAIALRIDEMRAKKLLPKLDARERHDIEKSTVSAIRTVGWTARLFGMRPPAVYARDAELTGGLALVPAIEPSIALGKSMLSGRSVPELTFLIGYELAWERMAERMVAMYPSVPDLRNLVVAAIAIVVPSDLPQELATLRQSLAQRLDAVQRLKLETAVKSLTSRGGQLDLVSWIRGTESTACRAGLLASGDINVAARLLAVDGRVVGGLTARDRVRDLIPFSISERYASLRRAIGVAAGS